MAGIMAAMAREQIRIGQVARRLGGTRVLALPLLRILAILAGVVWVALAPISHRQWGGVHGALLGFLLYGVAVIVAMWSRPGAMLRLNVWVLGADVVFALVFIHFTGGAQSTFFLALLLIAGLQSYYYGMTRGVAVALASGAAYLAVGWPTIGEGEWANVAIRLVMLVGTAIGLGILARVEDAERLAVATLTGQAKIREQFIRSVVESLSEGLVVLDLEGRVVAWNRAMEDRHGLTSGEVLGRVFLDIFPNYRREVVAEPLERLLRGEVAVFTLDAVVHDTLRRGRVVQNMKGSLLRQDGRPAGAVLLIQDVTERVAFERSVRQSEKLAGLGTLAAGIAHEMNNPIGIISSRIEIMLLDAESDPLPAEVMEDLRVLHRHAQRVARIAQGLLSFARQAPGEGRRTPVDLNTLVEDTLLLVEKQVVKGGIAVKRMLDPGLPQVWGDENALQQVLMNLLTNARDALGAGGEISIETGIAPGEAEAVRLVVRDTGPGIPPDVLPRIFDPFFTTKPSGTGLGLSVSYGIVRDHKGTLEVESRPGEGTAFILTLSPLGREAAL
jgi:two-component system, NtrC family, sensor kinase